MSPAKSAKKPQTRGIRVYTREDRPGRVFVQWGAKIDGKRKLKTKSFASQSAANEFALALKQKRREHGSAALNFDPVSHRRFLDFQEAIGNADLFEVLKVWQDHQRRKSAFTLFFAVEKYLAIHREEISTEKNKTHVALHLSRFCEFSGNRPLHEIDSDSIREFLRQLRETKDFQAVTVRHHLRTLKAFFNRATIEQWSVENPAARVPSPRVNDQEVSVMPLADAKTLFSFIQNNPIAPRLALEAFGGLRNASAEKLRLEDIDWSNRGITLPAASHKSRKRHYIENQPENLWTWLEAWRNDPRPWKMTRRQCLEAKSKAFLDSGVPHPHNVLRHSFCSYHIAMRTDAALTAVLLQHRNPSTLYQHYKGRATASDAEAFFSIVP